MRCGIKKKTCKIDLANEFSLLLKNAEHIAVHIHFISLLHFNCIHRIKITFDINITSLSLNTINYRSFFI